MNTTILVKKIKHQRHILLPRLVKAELCLNYLLTSVIHFSERKRYSITSSQKVSQEKTKASSWPLSRLNRSILIILILLILMPQSNFKMRKDNGNSCMRAASLANMTNSVEKELLLL